MIKLALSPKTDPQMRYKFAVELARKFNSKTKSDFRNSIRNLVRTLANDPLMPEKYQLRLLVVLNTLLAQSKKSFQKWRKKLADKGKRYYKPKANIGNIEHDKLVLLGLAVPIPPPEAPRRVLVLANSVGHYHSWLITMPDKDRVKYNGKNTKFLKSIEDCGEEQFSDFVCAGVRWKLRKDKEVMLAFGNKFKKVPVPIIEKPHVEQRIIESQQWTYPRASPEPSDAGVRACGDGAPSEQLSQGSAN